MHLLEIFAAQRSLAHWLIHLPKIVSLYLDNIAGVYAFRHFYIRDHFELSLELQDLALSLWKRKVDVVGTYYVPSRNNVEADELSRLWNYRFDWRLDPEIFGKFMSFVLRNKHPVPVIDRFATAANTVLRRFNSLYDDTGSEGNFWLCDPSKSVSWMNPPWNMFQEVIDFLQRFSCTAWILAPCWPQKPWFQFLELKSQFKYSLPRKEILFRPETAPPGREQLPPKYPCAIYLFRFPC